MILEVIQQDSSEGSNQLCYPGITPMDHNNNHHDMITLKIWLWNVYNISPAPKHWAEGVDRRNVRARGKEI